MTARPHKPSLKLGVDTYAIVLIVASSLYFLRLPGLSIYIFDLVWLLGLLMFPGLFLRMPSFLYVSLSAFAGTVFLSVIYCLVDGRPTELMQAITILLRFFQIAICANFFYNCVRTKSLKFTNLAISALIGLLMPIVGGLILYAVSPDSAITFNRYSGYIDNPNNIGLYIAIATPVFFSLLRLQVLPKYLGVVASALFMLIATYSLILAGSYSGTILFVVALFLSALNSVKSALFAAAGLLALYATISLFNDSLVFWAHELSASDFSGFRRTGTLLLSLLYNFNPSDLGSHSYRLQLQEFLFYKQFSDFIAIVLGLGPGQSHLLVLQTEGNSATIHNFYLRMFVEFGVFGCAMFAILIFSFFRRFAWRFLSFLITSGLVLASLGTPALYLPFFWMPPLAGLALVTLAVFAGSKTERIGARLGGGIQKPDRTATKARSSARGVA